MNEMADVEVLPDARRWRLRAIDPLQLLVLRLILRDTGEMWALEVLALFAGDGKDCAHNLHLRRHERLNVGVALDGIEPELACLFEGRKFLTVLAVAGDGWRHIKRLRVDEVFFTHVTRPPSAP